MTNHTQEQWNLFGNGQSGYRIQVVRHPLEHTIADIPATFSPKEVTANAALISAAPELLAACNEALRLIVAMASHQHEPDRIEEVCTKLEQAIEKAIYNREGYRYDKRPD